MHREGAPSLSKRQRKKASPRLSESGGCASFCHRAGLSPRERILIPSKRKRERQLALSTFSNKETKIKREGPPSLFKRQKERAFSKLKEAASS